MHKLMQKMMDKKRGDAKELSSSAKKAKIGVVEDLKKMAEDAMRDRGLKKVSVASDSAEGLKSGLDAAKHKVEEMSESHESPDSEHEDGEIVSPEDEKEMLEDSEYGKAHGADDLSGGGHGKHGDDRLQSTLDDESDDKEASEDVDHSDEDESEIDRKLAELMAKKKKFSSKRI